MKQAELMNVISLQNKVYDAMIDEHKKIFKLVIKQINRESYKTALLKLQQVYDEIVVYQQSNK